MEGEGGRSSQEGQGKGKDTLLVTVTTEGCDWLALEQCFNVKLVVAMAGTGRQVCVPLLCWLLFSTAPQQSGRLGSSEGLP